MRIRAGASSMDVQLHPAASCLASNVLRSMATKPKG